MQLALYNPHRVFSTRRNHPARLFDSFFDDFFRPFQREKECVQGTTAVGSMKVDIYEQENTIMVEAELPGMSKEDIKLDVQGKLLTISAQRDKEQEVKEENVYRHERSYGSVERTFNLGFEIDADKVVAKHENGVLKLEVPRPKEEETKRIEIA